MSRRTTSAFLVLASTASLVALVACGDDDNNPVKPADAGTDSTVVDSGKDTSVPSGSVTQSGKIVTINTTTGVAGATVMLGTATGTTDSKGLYAIAVPKDTPYEMSVTAPTGFYKLIEQEWSIKADVSRENTSFVSETAAGLLLPALEQRGGCAAPGTGSTGPGCRDETKGVVSVQLILRPGCTTTGGATIEVTPNDATTRVVYFDDGALPSGNTSTSAVADVLPHAAIYNIPVGQVVIKVTSPSCGQMAWPVDFEQTAGDGVIHYTGRVRVEAGKTLSFERVFMGAPVATDAGSDAGNDAADAADADGG